MPQLLELDRQGEASTTVGGLGGIQSPLVPCLGAWQARLWALPDQQLARYVLDGLREGFRIGFKRQCTLTAASTNLPLAYQQSQAVGRMRGFRPHCSQPVHVNRVGVVPKGHTPRQWRMITDLSFPEGSSVNDGVDSALCSLEYISVDRVAQVIADLGVGTLMAKIDIKSAYLIIPVHPGLFWDGNGRDRYLWTLLCHLAYAQLPRSLRLWRMSLSGAFGRQGCSMWTTTWTTTLCWEHRVQWNVPRAWSG